MLVWVAFFTSVIAIHVSGQDASQPNAPSKPPLYKEKPSNDGYHTSNPPPVGAGTYHYYDAKGTLHIANYVNDMYGFRILSEYTPFAPLTTLMESDKSQKPPKTKGRNKLNIETFDLFEEVEEPTPKPKKQSSKDKKENAETKQTIDHQPAPSTVSETVQEPKMLSGRMPSGTFKWPSYPTVMDMAGSEGRDSKYFYSPRIFFNENSPLPVTAQTPTVENNDATSTSEPPKEATTVPSITTQASPSDKSEELPATDKGDELTTQATPTASTKPFSGFYAINHSPSWAGRSSFPASANTGFSIRYGTMNVQPFAPQLATTSFNNLWPTYRRLGNGVNFGTNAGTMLWGYAK